MDFLRKSLFAFILLSSALSWAGSVRIAATVDIRSALEALVKEYAMQNNQDKIDVGYGSSSKFVKQIKEGASFDVLLSGDTASAQLLVNDKLNVSPLFPYAQDHLVLWVKNNSSLVLDKDIKVLANANIKKIAIANSSLSSYGHQAEAALKKKKIYDSLSKKLLVVDSTPLVIQAVESGTADIGFISQSAAQSEVLKKEGRFVQVDSSLAPPLVLAGVVIRSKNHETSENFKKFMISEKARKILKDFGFEPATK